MSNDTKDNPLERFDHAWQTWLAAPESPDEHELRSSLPRLLAERRPRKAPLVAALLAAAVLLFALCAGLVSRHLRQEPGEPALVHAVSNNVVLLVTDTGEPVYVVLDSNQKGEL